MKSVQTQLVVLPDVPTQRWSCHGCGLCCRTLVVHLFEEDRQRIDQQGWAEKLGYQPYVRFGRGWVLAKHQDEKHGGESCVFLDEQNRCKIHAAYGESSKPLACRIFPFSVRPTSGGQRVSLRFDCPSVTSSQGEPIRSYSGYLRGLVRQLGHPPHAGDDVADWQRGVTATVDEIDMLIDRLDRWFGDDDRSIMHRLIGAARLTETLSVARLKKVRGARFGELLDLLFGSLPLECGVKPSPPTRRQCAMIRQLAFVHAERVPLNIVRARWGRVAIKRRWEQLRAARRFRIGKGVVPRLSDYPQDTTFETIDRIRADSEDDHRDRIDQLLRRYVCARLQSRSFFGNGYYGWPILAGLSALWACIAAAGWMARYVAAVAGRRAFTFDDTASAIGIVDRAASRVPGLGTLAERARLAVLTDDDGLARLIHHYALIETDEI